MRFLLILDDVEDRIGLRCVWLRGDGNLRYEGEEGFDKMSDAHKAGWEIGQFAEQIMTAVVEPAIKAGNQWMGDDVPGSRPPVTSKEPEEPAIHQPGLRLIH